MSACDALEIVKPKLQQGTILMMDDWNCFRADNNQGERRALRGFFKIIVTLKLTTVRGKQA
jgi:hypothetical protein